MEYRFYAEIVTDIIAHNTKRKEFRQDKILDILYAWNIQKYVICAIDKKTKIEIKN